MFTAKKKVRKDKKGKTCTVNNYGFKTPHLVLSKYSHNNKKQTHTHMFIIFKYFFFLILNLTSILFSKFCLNIFFSFFFVLVKENDFPFIYFGFFFHFFFVTKRKKLH